MTDVSDETLSAWRAGDLDPKAAAVVALALREDPALRARLARLDALVAALERLERPARRPPASAPRWVREGQAVAAGLLIGFGLAHGRRPPPEVVWGGGPVVVEGAGSIVLGVTRAQLDGRLVVTPEPGRDVPRGTSQEDGMKTWGVGLGGVAVGVAATLFVERGTLTVIEDGDVPRTVGPGERLVLGAPPSSPAETPQAELTRLRAELATLRQDKATAEFQAAVAEGQLVAERGEAIAWPAHVRAALLPAAFEGTVRSRFGPDSGVEVVAVDCAEFPCLAVVRTPSTGETGVPAPIKALLGDEAAWGGEVGAWVAASENVGEDGAAATVAFALGDADTWAGPEVGARLGWRSREWLEAGP